MVEPLTSRINRQASLSSRFAGLAVASMVSPNAGSSEGRADLPPGAPFVVCQNAKSDATIYASAR